MSVLYWQDRPIDLLGGETVAAALNRAGVRDFGGGRHFCGTGQCQNCVVQDLSGGSFEACIAPARADMRLAPLLPVHKYG